MKFHEIAVGARFEFEGVEYTKTDHLLALSKDGKQRLIRRSASLKSLDIADRKSDESAENIDYLDRKKALLAFDHFYQTCLSVAGKNPELESARLRFLDALK